MNPIEKLKIESEQKPEDDDKKEDFTSIRRVIGRKYEDISEEEKQKILGYMEEIFKDQKKFKEDLVRDYGSIDNIPEVIRTIFFEKEKTTEELEIINIVNDKTNELRKKFGLPELNIPPNNVYLIPRDAPWPNDLKSDYYFIVGQFIVVREPETEQMRRSNVILAANIIHEMMEFKSYNALKKLEHVRSLGVYRSGLQTYRRPDSGESYFGNIDEAIKEELTIRLLKELKGHHLFESEFNQTNKIKKYLLDKKSAESDPFTSEDTFYIKFDQKSLELHSERFGRTQERRVLNTLIDKIYQNQRNADQFKSKEEIFDIFFRASMTGKTVGLWRLVEQTFGKGTFRKIAETGEDINKLEKYIDKIG